MLIHLERPPFSTPFDSQGPCYLTSFSTHADSLTILARLLGARTAFCIGFHISELNRLTENGKLSLVPVDYDEELAAAELKDAFLEGAAKMQAKWLKPNGHLDDPWFIHPPEYFRLLLNRC